ncbi:MAG: hypothetical protein COB35_07175 [Gammaproteobacteria bacterium]|nr:MAG: hypothetical protein COB35_07175 [Gammaproteobacteria bacterium]
MPILLTPFLSTPSIANEFEVSGKIGLEARYFFQQAQFSEQNGQSNLSVFVEPELYWNWNNEDDSLIFKPYLRDDQHDSQRSHGDIRELTWTHVGNDWELRTGINKVYWGVTEFQHLVDVINQTDSVEDIDGEDKLGQQMINLSLVRDWGIVDILVMPGFRERTFAGQKGRLRSGLVVNTSKAEYQASAGQQHVDYALRWTTSIGDFDIGTSYFNGTNRDPLFNVASVFSAQSQQATGLELTPYYVLMEQVSVDIQATLGDWLWKVEGLYRDTNSQNYWASQVGFEYTRVGVFDSAIDIGYLVEYGWDSRGENIAVINQNDVFFGSRIAFNDVQSSEILWGAGVDLDHNAQSIIVEASRRLGDSYKLSLDVRFFNSKNVQDILTQLDQDDHIQLTLERYF